VVPSGRDKNEAEQQRYYAYAQGKQSGIYAVDGEERVTIDLGRNAWKSGDPHAYTAYDVNERADR
jgi:hypothetical protein